MAVGAVSIRYKGDRVRNGLIHFVLGKAVSSFAGFGAIVLVVRLLTIEAFADYSVLMALVELVAAVSSVGLAHALLRYVPELYSAHYRIALRQFVFGSLLLRTLVILGVLLVAYAFSPRAASLIGVVEDAFEAFLAIMVLRATARFLAQILESTLHQGSAQTGYSLSALTRLFGMIWLMSQGAAHLTDVILVEAVAEGLSLLVLLANVIKVTNDTSGPVAPSDDSTWLASRLRQILRFGLSGYVQHMVALPFGSNMNRLLGGRLLGDLAMANFGFATSLYEYLKRYLPAQLFVGLIRPVLVARYAERRDFSAAAGLCEQVFQANLFMIGFAFVFLLIGGTECLSAISGGKYSSEALIILAWLVVGLALETHRLQLEVLVQTVEHYEFLIPSNIILALSVLPAVALLPSIGTVAFPVANCTGLLIANAWVAHRLSRNGQVYRHRWTNTLALSGAMVLAATIGTLLRLLGLHWWLSAMASLILYGLAGWRLTANDVRRLLHNLIGVAPGNPIVAALGRKVQARGQPPATSANTALDVGILSMQRIVNYGSFLQAYALKRLVESFGHRCTFRDFRPGKPRHKGSKVKDFGLATRLASLPRVAAHPIALLDRRMFRRRIHRMFESFCWPVLGLGTAKNYDLKCDIMIIGSDEVFNYTQNSAFGYVPCLFGHDIEAGRVASYAASAGFANLVDIEADGIGPELAAGFKRFDALSVRDGNTFAIVSKYSGREPVLVLDPALVFDFTDELVPAQRDDAYLLIYAYEGRMEDPAEIHWVRRFANEQGLRTVAVGFYHHWCDENLAPTPFEMLGLFAKARFVVTDTFHGTIFSIKFSRQFVTLIRHENDFGSNTNKVSFLLQQFGLEGRVIQQMDLLAEFLVQPIDYEDVGRRMAHMRTVSTRYLREVLATELPEAKCARQRRQA